MSKRRLIVTSIVGLVLAILEVVLFPSTVKSDNATNSLSIVVLILAFATAICAGLAILGHRSAHRYYKIAIPVLSAISAIAFCSAASSWYINLRITAHVADTTHSTSFLIALIVGIVVYLIAATVYGFAGTSQGVKVGQRVGLLLLLLLGVVPVLNVLGMAGFLITSLTRKAASA